MYLRSVVFIVYFVFACIFLLSVAFFCCFRVFEKRNLFCWFYVLVRADVLLVRADVLLTCADVLLKCADVLLKRAKWYRHASTCRCDLLCKCAA